MTSLRIYHLVHVGVVLSLLSQDAPAQDRRQLDREAAAALALAAAKRPAPRAAVAPMPREKQAKTGDCPCCTSGKCTCCGSPDCPGKCEKCLPAKKTAEVKVPTPMPPSQPQMTLRLVGYNQFGQAVYQWAPAAAIAPAPQPYCPPGGS